jgi:hypothetical protein
MQTASLVRRCLVIGLCATGLVCCADSTDSDGDVLAEATVGAEGGRLEGDGLLLEIPAGALDGPTDLSVSIASHELPGAALLTPVLQFEPEGLRFERPATLELTLEGSGEGVVFWSQDDGEYGVIGRIEGGRGSVELQHFSSGGGAECTTVNACICTADDQLGGSACYHQPCDSADGRCPIQTCTPDTTGTFIGQNGGANSGWIIRPQRQCSCECRGSVTYTWSGQTDPRAYLCRRPLREVNGIPICASDLRGQEPTLPTDEEPEVPIERTDFALDAWLAPTPPLEDDPNPTATCAAVTGPCQGTGYWMDWSSADAAGYNREASGELAACEPVLTEFLWRQVPCTYEGCGPRPIGEVMELRARAADQSREPGDPEPTVVDYQDNPYFSLAECFEDTDPGL